MMLFFSFFQLSALSDLDAVEDRNVSTFMHRNHVNLSFPFAT